MFLVIKKNATLIRKRITWVIKMKINNKIRFLCLEFVINRVYKIQNRDAIKYIPLTILRNDQRSFFIDKLNDYRLAVKVDPAEAITTQTTAKIS